MTIAADEMIEEFKKAVADIWARDGQNSWPIEINAIVHLFMDLFAAELLVDMDKLAAEGYSRQQVAETFRTSARIVRLIMPIVQGMKALDIPIDKQRERVVELLSLVETLKHGDLFNRDGKNIVLSPEAFEKDVSRQKMSPVDTESSLAVHRLCALLWNYAECVCFKTHGLIREFHGPYGFPGDTAEILIRDFICMKAAPLWDECRQVPYESVRVAAAYSGLEMRVDIYNNVAIKEGSRYLQGLDAYFVEADGRLLDRTEIEALCSRLSQAMISITARVEAMDWRRLAEKYAEIFWFAKRELCAKARGGQDWLPPAAVKERIRQGTLNTRLQNVSPAVLQRMLRIAF